MEESCFEIRASEGKGLGLFASKHFNKDEIIFQEIPLVSCQFAWNEDYGYQACELCLSPLETAEENVKRLTMNEFVSLPYPEMCNVDKSKQTSCFSCGVKYCSIECRDSAWEKYHKTLCFKNNLDNDTHPIKILKEIWKEMHYPPETTTVMLFLKIFAMVYQSDNKSLLQSTLNQFCHETVNEAEDITHKLIGLKFTSQVDALREGITRALPTYDLTEWLTPNGFIKLIALVGMNGQGIGTSSFSKWVQNVSNLELSTDERENVDNMIKKIYESFENGVGDFLNNEGSGLYVIQSRINHSCRPNAEITFPNGNYQLAVRATKSINLGEEICISYLDECVLERSRHTRQKILQENYLFRCKCEKCEEEIDQLDETSSDDSDDDKDSN